MLFACMYVIYRVVQISVNIKKRKNNSHTNDDKYAVCTENMEIRCFFLLIFCRGTNIYYPHNLHPRPEYGVVSCRSGIMAFKYL